MNMRRQAILAGSFLVCLGSLLAARDTLAVIVASDNASDPAYADGWDEDDNGGTGFLPWTGGMYGNPVAIDSGEAPDNDLGGPAFQFGTGGSGYWAIRPFASPLQPGQSFKIDLDPWAFPTDASASGEYQSMVRFGAGGSGNGQERIGIYTYAFYTAGVLSFGSDKWGVVAETTNDGLNGGAPLPTTPCYATGCTSYSMVDGSDGFTMVLDLLTIDTYRMRIVDDGITKVDVSGQLNADTAGQGINQLVFWSADGGGATIDTSYFNSLEIYTTPTEGLAGDYNGDNKVDAADYTVWRDNRGAADESSIHNNGDQLNGVDVADYGVWKNAFGDPAGAGGSASGAVPEPASWLGMLLGAVAGLQRLRRRAD